MALPSHISNGQHIGRDQGASAPEPSKGDLALFLKVFAGEVVTAFARKSKTLGKLMKRTISSGKSAQFPVLGRTAARYLQVGDSLDDTRIDIKHTERVVNIEGLLASDVLIYDIEDAMNHYDVRSEYSNQIGEALAMSVDNGSLAAMAVMVNADSENIETSSAFNPNTKVAGTGKPIAISVKTPDYIDGLEAHGKQIVNALLRVKAHMGTNYVPAEERTVWLSPLGYAAVSAALMPNSSNWQSQYDAETGVLNGLLGFEIIETPNLGQSADDYENSNSGNGKFPSTGEGTVTDSNVVALIAHRSAVGNVTLKDLSMERARRAEYQADQIIAKLAQGTSGLRPEATAAIYIESGSAAAAARK